MSASRSRGQRAGLEMTAVVDAALEVVRAFGPDQLSMRSVASRLGVAPNALYSYVDSKDALVDALLDGRLQGIPDPDVAGDPQREVLSCMLTTYDTLLDEPRLVSLYLSRQGSRGPRATELGRALESLLVKLGVAPQETRVVVRVLVLITIGIAAQAIAPDGPLSTSELRRTLASSLTWVLDGAARTD